MFKITFIIEMMIGLFVGHLIFGIVSPYMSVQDGIGIGILSAIVCMFLMFGVNFFVSLFKKK